MQQSLNNNNNNFISVSMCSAYLQLIEDTIYNIYHYYNVGQLLYIYWHKYTIFKIHAQFKNIT
jgi:hypothetical protein